MYFKYRNYSHEENEVSFQHSRQAKLDSSGTPYGYTESYRLRGRLHGDTQSELTTKIDALKAAYSVQFGDLILYDNSGAVTSHTLLNNNTLGGVKVVEGPSFPESMGAEYSTYRSYEIVVQADVGITGQGNSSITDWQESLTFIGTGGPRYVWQTMLTGPPIRQQVSQLTTIKAIQRGSAVAFADYAAFPPPLFPIDVEHEEQRVYERGTPQYVGGIRRYFPSMWTYSFEFNNPLTGNPTGRPT